MGCAPPIGWLPLAPSPLCNACSKTSVCCLWPRTARRALVDGMTGMTEGWSLRFMKTRWLSYWEKCIDCTSFSHSGCFCSHINSHVGLKIGWLLLFPYQFFMWDWKLEQHPQHYHFMENLIMNRWIWAQDYGTNPWRHPFLKMTKKMSQGNSCVGTLPFTPKSGKLDAHALKRTKYG